MLAHHTTRGTHARSRVGKIVVSTVPVAALILLAGCGSTDPQVDDKPTSTQPTSSDTAPTTTAAQETSAEPTDTESATDNPSTESTSESTTEATESATESASATGEPPVEDAGDPATQGLEISQEYAYLVATGATDQAYGMLSPEAMVYFPDVSVFEENGVADLADDLAAASESQWAIRPAYEETHDSAQVVSVWGEGAGGEPFAHSWAVRLLDGSSWVIDQEITPSTGSSRLNWLNPGIQEGVRWWEVNTESPISFALLKKDGPNVAVTASIDDGGEMSQRLVDLPTGGAVVYELSNSALNEGLHAVTASWVAEDYPFVHTSSTPAANPGGR